MSLTPYIYKPKFTKETCSECKKPWERENGDDRHKGFCSYKCEAQVKTLTLRMAELLLRIQFEGVEFGYYNASDPCCPVCLAIDYCGDGSASHQSDCELAMLVKEAGLNIKTNL